MVPAERQCQAECQTVALHGSSLAVVCLLRDTAERQEERRCLLESRLLEGKKTDFSPILRSAVRARHYWLVGGSGCVCVRVRVRLFLVSLLRSLLSSVPYSPASPFFFASSSSTSSTGSHHSSSLSGLLFFYRLKPSIPRIRCPFSTPAPGSSRSLSSTALSCQTPTSFRALHRHPVLAQPVENRAESCLALLVQWKSQQSTHSRS